MTKRAADWGHIHSLAGGGGRTSEQQEGAPLVELGTPPMPEKPFSYRTFFVSHYIYLFLNTGSRRKINRDVMVRRGRRQIPECTVYSLSATQARRSSFGKRQPRTPNRAAPCGILHLTRSQHRNKIVISLLHRACSSTNKMRFTQTFQQNKMVCFCFF